MALHGETTPGDENSVKAVSETADKLLYDRLLLSNEFSGCGRLP
jgi:hypothetical protein